MGYYISKVPVQSTATALNKPFSRITDVKTQPGYETELLKANRLNKETPPDQTINLTNDYNEVGLIHQENTYVDSVKSLVQGKGDEYTAKVLRATRDYSGYITGDLKPLGTREEQAIDRKTGLDGKYYFWEKGAN